MASELNMGNLYEFNKNVIKSQEPIDTILANRRINEIAESMYFLNNKYIEDALFFMICPDNRQYILFKIDNDSSIRSICDSLYEVIKNRGKIIDIDMTHKDEYIWEIWIEDRFTKELYMYQLTNYTDNVVTC